MQTLHLPPGGGEQGGWALPLDRPGVKGLTLPGPHLGLSQFTCKVKVLTHGPTGR